MGLYPSDHLKGLKGLGNVVGTTQRETLHLGLQVIQRRQKYNRTVSGRLVGLEALTHLIAVHVGHHDIQQDHFGLMPVGEVQCFLALVGDQQAIAFILQGLIEDFEVLRIVIHKQNRHLRVLTDNFSHIKGAG